ncbi:MAG: hypothetical protein WAM81_01490 [Acidimicrobiia bacterium]
MHQGLAVRLSALEGEIVRVEGMAEGSWAGPFAERFHQEVTRQRRVIRQVMNELLEAP